MKTSSIRFCLVDGKKPLGLEWDSEEKALTVNNQKLLKRLESNENYGVIGGYGNLLIVDADNEKILEAFSILEDTFTVKTGNGTHLYYYAPGLEKSIALQEETEESTPEKPVFKNIGHMTFKGRMVVGPNCIHYQLNEKTKLYEKTGKKYKIIKDVPIKVVDASIVMNIIKPFLADEIRKNYQQQNEAKTTDATNLIEIPIDIVANKMNNLSRSSAPIGYRGHNPDHPQSKSRQDLTIDTNKNWWICSACCNSGYGYGNALYLIALNEGILHCHECRKGGLRGDNFKKVKDIAIEKYGVEPSYFKEMAWIKDEKKIVVPIGNDGRKLTIFPCEKKCFGLYDDKTILMEKTETKSEWFTNMFYQNKIKKILRKQYKLTEDLMSQTMGTIIKEVENATKNNNEPKKKEKSSIPPEDVIKLVTSVGVVLSEDTNIYQIAVNGFTFKLTDEQLLYGSKSFCLKYMNTFLEAIRITDDDWRSTILPFILTQAKATRENEKEERIESNNQLVVGLFSSYAKGKACFDWDDQQKRMHYQNATFYDKENNAIRISSEFIREFYQMENIKLRYNVTKEQFDAELRDQKFLVRKRITGLVNGIEKTFRLFSTEKIGISEKQVSKRTEQEPKDAILGVPPLDAFKENDEERKDG